MVALLETIKWKPFYISSAAIVVLVLLTYSFFPTLSVVLFFALIGLWSRIQCMTNPITKDLEMIDFFSVMIALNVSAFAGAFYAGGLLLFSHFFSKIERPRYAIYDSIALFIAALATPLIYSYLGGNLLLTMYAYSVIRYLVRGVFFLSLWAGELPGLMPSILINIGIAYLTNTVYVLLFGNYITKMFTQGFKIHWGFFLFAIFILGFVGFTKWLRKQKWIPSEVKNV